MSIALVTGGAGFIGSHLVDRLLKEGRDVRVVDNFSTGRRANIAHLLDSIDLREIDIRDLDALRDAVKDVDVVFHEAALASVPRSVDDPVTSNDVNVVGTLNVLVAARDAGVRYAIVHRDQLMEDHYVEAAGAIRRHSILLAEDERMQIYALY